MDNVGQSYTGPGSFAIATDVYSGPLDLLIDLIEKRKLMINDISLAAVTDDYMRYAALLEQNPLSETAQFVVLASTLLLIKSKSLLPMFDLTQSEEESVENLQNRLRLYQIYRSAGTNVGKIFGVHVSYERTFIPSTEPIFTLDSYTEVDKLHNALQDIIARLPKKKVAIKKTISLEEMIDRLKTRIEKQLTLRFNEFTGNEREKATIIVGFLAVLEMVKQGSVIVRQTARYHDIEIERESGSVPRYL